jgi:DNA-binding GntR family transcriptional regulator
MDSPNSEPATKSVPAPGHPNYHRVQDLIRADIVEGRLKANVRLKVAELAKRYGVSAIPIREALQRLEGEGLIIIEPNCGARVRMLDERFLRNITDISLLLEPYIVRGFVKTASDDDVKELQAIQKRIEKAARLGDFDTFHDENGKFHACMHRRHYNDEALRIMAQHGALRRTLSGKYRVSNVRMNQSCQEHRKILDAVIAGDAEAAGEAMAEHSARSKAYLLGLVRADRGASESNRIGRDQSKEKLHPARP